MKKFIKQLVNNQGSTLFMGLWVITSILFYWTFYDKADFFINIFRSSIMPAMPATDFQQSIYNLILFFILVLIPSMLIYLRGSRITYNTIRSSDSGISMRLLEDELKHQRSELKTLHAKLKHLSNPINEEDRAEIANHLKSEISKEFSQEYLDEIAQSLANKYAISHNMTDIYRNFIQITDRLFAEMQTLTRRGNLNLVIGIVTTLIAIALLYSAILVPVETEKDDFLLQYATLILPKISLSIFIEIFSFFFLKLYKSSLLEIKYYQNELTNIESKRIALKTATALGKDDLENNFINIMANTERNFVLKQGETTVEIEKSKLLQDEVNAMRNSMMKMFNMNKNTG